MKYFLVTAFAIINGCFVMGQSPYANDRVYTANQVSNTVSVISPYKNKLLGEIKLGNPFPNVLSPLYKGQVLVHGLRYSPQRKMLAVVSIGSNSITLVSTEDNHILKTIYIGRSPHEPTFTPDNKQIWISVRGESYVSVIDVDRMQEVKQIPVANGPGMISFSPNGRLAYVCSSFTPELDIINTSTYRIIKRIPVVSPFSPNIFTSPDGKWVALTHKDVGKVTIINTGKMTVEKVIVTGMITNHVTFSIVNNKLLMMVTVGGENKVKIFDVDGGFSLLNTINTGALPHGIWPSPDGKMMFIGLEYGDQVQGIDLQNMKIFTTIQVGHSPQALVYAANAVSDPESIENLSPLSDTAATQIISLKSSDKNSEAVGKLAVRSIGLIDLVEQIFTGLQSNNSYTLILTNSDVAPYKPEYEINKFTADENGKYSGQSTGQIKLVKEGAKMQVYRHIVLINNNSNESLITDGF